MLDSVMLTAFADELGEMRKEAVNPYLAAGLGAAGLGAAGLAGGALMGGAGGAGVARAAQSNRRNIDYRAHAEGRMSSDEFRARQSGRLKGMAGAGAAGTGLGGAAGLAGGALAGGALAGGAAAAAPHARGWVEKAKNIGSRAVETGKNLATGAEAIGKDVGKLEHMTGGEKIRHAASNIVGGGAQGLMQAPQRAAAETVGDVARHSGLSKLWQGAKNLAMHEPSWQPTFLKGRSILSRLH